jgi:pilus assembly protein CpaE
MQSLLIIISQADREPWAQALAAALQPAQLTLLVSNPAQAGNYIAQQAIHPSHVVLDIGARGADILPEIDALAEQCRPGTRVIAVGNTNDITLYREMLARGVLDYLPMPAAIDAVVKSLTAEQAKPAIAAPAPQPVHSDISNKATKRVIIFMSAASGDGASTVALNTAYVISQLAPGKTVLVDMDYQFGMVAKNLAVQNQYGIRELFDHPERGVDSTLIKRMVSSYQKLDVISAPGELRYLPNVSADAITDLITTLKESYDTIIIDLPHVWLPWVASATQQSTHLVLVAQLWLKSVSHAARMMRAFREIHVTKNVIAVINRSGAKFKEAIEPKDFERVCGTPVSHFISNDIRTIVTAEAAATTLIELPPSDIAQDIQKLARSLLGLSGDTVTGEKRSSLFSKLKG